MRRAAQGDVLPRARAGTPGSAITSATSSTTRRWSPTGRASSTSSACSRLRPELVAHDLHPDYASTAYALERDGVELTGVQHHHAHLAACLAEHGLEGPAVGAIYDGSGFGSDGTIWGGEVLVGDLVAFERGSVAAGGAHARRRRRDPRAVAHGLRVAARPRTGSRCPCPATLASAVDPVRWGQVARIAESPSVSPQTTSMGRLFDAVAALCGLRAPRHLRRSSCS